MRSCVGTAAGYMRRPARSLEGGIRDNCTRCIETLENRTLGSPPKRPPAGAESLACTGEAQPITRNHLP